MSEERIVSCPFCGSSGKPRHVKSTPYAADWTWVVACQDLECGAVGPSTDTEQKAIRSWNERA